MIVNICILLISGIILCTPLVLWSYLASEYPQISFSRSYFFFGTLIGGLTTLPFVLQQHIFIFSDIFENIFYSQNIGQFTAYVGWLLLLFAIFWSVLILVSFCMRSKKYLYFGASYLGSCVIIFLSSFVSFFFVYFLSGFHLEMNILYGKLVFSTFAGVMSYYLTVALLEEGMKHIGAASVLKSTALKQYKKTILLGISVALGFAFFENILYAFSYIQDTGVDSALISLSIFRSVFTVGLHILATAVFLSAFFIFTNLYTGRKIYKIGGALLLAFIAIFAHMLFDVFVVFGYTSVLFLYVLSLYIFVVILTNPEKSVYVVESR